MAILNEENLKNFGLFNELRHAEDDRINDNRVVCLSIGIPTVILGILALCSHINILESI